MLPGSWQSLVLPLVVPVATLLAFRGQPQDLGDVSMHPRFRTVDEDTGLKAFVGIRVSAPSIATLLTTVQALVAPVKAAKRDAADARLSGEWDIVHEVELVVGEEVTRMDAAEFAQLVNDARYRSIRERPPIIAPSRR